MILNFWLTKLCFKKDIWGYKKAEDLKRRVCKKYEKYEILSYVIEHRAYATSD